MTKIVKRTLIDCTQEELFTFHLDTNNIKKITPTHTKVALLNYDENIYEGKIVDLKTTRAFIPILWKVQIETIDHPNSLVDIALKSPFSYWKHQHNFIQKGDKTLLEDIIEYELPFGALGKLVNIFIKKDIENMFSYRHKQTKKILES
jgi:ligand-binding SRPBCC domain-containing protein